MDVMPAHSPAAQHLTERRKQHALQFLPPTGATCWCVTRVAPAYLPPPPHHITARALLKRRQCYAIGQTGWAFG
jgi:hypothetical protein